MKVTIEPTGDQRMWSAECAHPKVVVEVPHDDLSFDDMIDVLKRCLHGMGYHHDTVEELYS